MRQQQIDLLAILSKPVDLVTEVCFPLKCQCCVVNLLPISLASTRIDRPNYVRSTGIIQRILSLLSVSVISVSSFVDIHGGIEVVEEGTHH